MNTYIYNKRKRNKLKQDISWLLLVTILIIAPFWGCATTQQAPQKTKETVKLQIKEKPSWYYKHLVDTEFVKQYTKFPKPKNVYIIDARPERKFIKGHIPFAINIPDTKFEKLIDRLPKDKNSLLIFYCGGPT